ncbi:MAG: alpha/beta fold hydrolase [Burkholderiales bacterium]|nr:alpha/beta fold hydrolase [Burkholderiales bacterium]
MPKVSNAFLRGVTALLLPPLTGCAVGSLEPLPDQLASQAEIAQGETFKHLVYLQPASGRLFFIMIEGDGTPWVQGRLPAADPTPSNPLVFRLAANTPAPAAYVGRPCYFRLGDRECRPYHWTQGRFSPEVVDSMAVVVNDLLATVAYERCVLVGHSGGGTLALLLASRVDDSCAVVTIAGPTDIHAWSSLHGYLPLVGSLNPSDEIDRLAGIQQFHLLGMRDDNVPPDLFETAFEESSEVEIWRFEDFNHVCCWEAHWDQLLLQLDAAL